MKKVAQTRAKEKIRRRAIGLSVTVASRVPVVSERSPFISPPPIRKLHNAADFVSVAQRSRKVFQRVYARVQRELGRASASLDIKETPTTTPPSHRARRLIALIYPQRLLIIYSPSTRTLSAGRLSRLPIYASPNFFPPFLRDEPFPVKFFGILVRREDVIVFLLFLYLFLPSFIYAECFFFFDIC